MTEHPKKRTRVTLSPNSHYDEWCTQGYVFVRGKFVTLNLLDAERCVFGSDGNLIFDQGEAHGAQRK